MPANFIDQRHLTALRLHWRRHHTFPPMAKLSAVLGLTSSTGAFKAVCRLEEAGYLERIEGRVAPTPRFFAYPLVREVRAGVPQPVDVDDFEVLNAEEYLVQCPERTTYARVKGDSMVGAGLLDGDIVVVETNAPTKPGDIVVAVVDDAVTVKYLQLDDDGNWVLEAANPAFDPIRPRGRLEVIGVVVSSFRRFRR